MNTDPGLPVISRIRVDPVPQPVEARTGVQTEDGPQDHFQRERLEPGVPRAGGDVLGPAGQLALQSRPHQAGEALHLLSVEGGQHRLRYARWAPSCCAGSASSGHHRLGVRAPLPDAAPPAER